MTEEMHEAAAALGREVDECIRDDPEHFERLRRRIAEYRAAKGRRA